MVRLGFPCMFFSVIIERLFFEMKIMSGWTTVWESKRTSMGDMKTFPI